MILSDLIDWLPIAIASAGFLVAAMLIIANQSLHTSRNKTIRQIPALLDLLIRSLRAGKTVPDAIGLVADMGPEPGRFEFDTCRRDLENGLPPNEALMRLGQRLKTFPIDLLPAVLCADPNCGLGIEEGLDLIKRISDESVAFRNGVRAFATPARRSAYCFLAMGPAAACLLFLFGPAAFVDMFRSGIGIKLLSISLGLEIIGGLWVLLLLQLCDSLEFSTE